jgi:hypothetical protein
MRPRRVDLRDERGASLVLALGVMLMVGAIAAGLLAFITTSVNARPALNETRNRQYAADAAIEMSIAAVRNLASPGLTACGGPRSATVNDVAITVECRNVPRLTSSGYLQRNVAFTACTGSGPCDATTTVIRAQVNFQSLSASPTSVEITRTYVQSWSVLR